MDQWQRQQTGFGGSAGFREETSTKDLITTLVDEAKRLVKAEVGIAKAELKHEAKKVQQGATSVAIGGGLAIAGGLVLCAFLVLLLATVMPAWLSALIVGVAFCAIGGFLAYGGLKRIKTVEPEKSFEHLEEDRQWLSSTMAAAKVANRSGVKQTPRAHA